MNYTPHTARDIEHMLGVLGVSSVGELFAPVPESLRLKNLALPHGISEMEAVAFVQSLADGIREQGAATSFLGGGAYDHFSPSVVDAMISRGEFFTAYTPYQPEVSQGTLRAIFEFQSMICELTGMEVANASMYDGASALAEAVLMAVRMNNGTRVLLPQSLHPFYRQVVATYVRGIGLELVDIPWSDSGAVDLAVLKRELTAQTAAVVVQNPNFFGVLESLGEIGDLVNQTQTAFVACVNPMSLSAIRPPGDFGADIVVGDGQPLGLPLSYGGPYCISRSARPQNARANLRRDDRCGWRARLCADVANARATHSARARHVEYLHQSNPVCNGDHRVFGSGRAAGVSRSGRIELASKPSRVARLDRIGRGCAKSFQGRYLTSLFWKPITRHRRCWLPLRQQGVEAGIDLGRFYPALENCILTCVTEKRTDADLDRLIDAWRAL